MKWSGADDWVRHLNFVRVPKALVAATRNVDCRVTTEDVHAVWLLDMHKFVLHDRFSMLTDFFDVDHFYYQDRYTICAKVKSEYADLTGNVSGRWFFFLKKKLAYSIPLAVGFGPGPNDQDRFLQMLVALDQYYEAEAGDIIFPYFDRATLEVGVTMARESDGILLEALRVNVAMDWHIFL